MKKIDRELSRHIGYVITIASRRLVKRKGKMIPETRIWYLGTIGERAGHIVVLDAEGVDQAMAHYRQWWEEETVRTDAVFVLTDAGKRNKRRIERRRCQCGYTPCPAQEG